MANVFGIIGSILANRNNTAPSPIAPAVLAAPGIDSVFSSIGAGRISTFDPSVLSNEIKKPQTQFDAAYYLAKYPDVAKNNYWKVRAEQHYNQYGKKEKRLINQWDENQKNGNNALVLKNLESLPALTSQEKLQQFNDSIQTANQIGYSGLTQAEKNLINASSKKSITSSPKNFNEAANNYYVAIAAASATGVENLTQAQKADLQNFSKDLRSFDSKELGANAKTLIANSQAAIDVINEIDNQRQIVATQNARPGQTPAGPQRQSEQGKAFVEQDKLSRLITTANQAVPSYLEAFTKYGVSDFTTGLESAAKSAAGVTAGLKDLSGEKIFSTGGLASKLNVQVTDEQILSDINTARQNQYKSLYESGTAAATDLQSQLSSANQFISSLPTNDRRRTEAQKTIDDLNTKLSQVQKDTLEAKNLYDNYTPISGESAASTISKFRESLQLPEERTMAQIESIDPTLGSTVRTLADQYKKMAETPTGPTTTAQTEELRSSLEQEALNQLKLGSTLGAEEQRQYQQAARAAQTARGNIFGVAPAVQEAVETGAAGEARKLARYGAASQFLSSGETTGAALARDTSLRNALEQSRLGAAQQFAASGPSMYNLSSQRLGQQQNLLNNYLAASAPQGTAGFATSPTATAGYQYVNPNAGFQGAQNAASIYNTLANFTADNYRTYVSGLSAQQPASSTFAQIAGGIGNIVSPFASAFKSYSLGGVG